MNRRELFGQIGSPFQDKNSAKPTIRPPYYIDEQSFDGCIVCEDKPCVVACETNIILIKETKPILDFSYSGCTYCDKCAHACLLDVLKIESKKYIKASFKIDVLKCLSWQSTMCFSCKDPCLDNAIVFDGLFKPVIQDNLCTSCGFCVQACPTAAIEILTTTKENI